MRIRICSAPVFALLFAALPALIYAQSPGASRLYIPTDKDWETLRLVWTSPDMANSFQSAPIGNGHIGARIGGGVDTEVMQLNDNRFWSGGPGLTPLDPMRRLALIQTRKLLAAGDIPGANAAAEGMWGSNDMGTFLPLGRITLSFPHTNDAAGYSRVLDIDRAVSTVQYTAGGVTYKREAFASFPDDVIVMRLTGSVRSKINLTAAFSYPVEMEGHGATVGTEGDDTLVMKLKAPSNSGWEDRAGIRAEARLRIEAQGGTISAKGKEVSVVNADSAILIFASATSYSGFDKEPGSQGINPAPIVEATLARAAAKGYDELLRRHAADYQRLFRRVWVQINGEQPNPYALGFQYARYDMIACSRLGDRPHNQQGMWNDSWTPTSHSAHWLNENVEKYYSLVETANLPECGEPLWNWMDELAASGARTAAVDWGFHGWLVGQCSDIWAKTTLASGNNEWSIWPMGGVWLCENLYDHYAFGQDTTFLRRRAYPLMKGAAEFCLDYLVEDGKGHLVTSPSTSPENRFLYTDGNAYAVTVGTTSDLSLVRQLFDNCIAAENILNVDSAFRAKLQSMEAKLLPFQINSKGELQEWNEDYAIPQTPAKYNPHRHASHLLGVWPLSQITERGTPEWFAAAKVSLRNRGRGGYHPDKGAMWARLKDGDKALAGGAGSFQTGNGVIGKIPPKYAGFPELLVQSHADAIELLPALPSTWKSGSIIGLRARGNFEIGMAWNNSLLEQATLTSRSGNPARVRAAIPLRVMYAGKPVSVTRPDPDSVAFPTKTNGIYELLPLRS